MHCAYAPKSVCNGHDCQLSFAARSSQEEQRKKGTALALQFFGPPVSVLSFGKVDESSLVDVVSMPQKGLDSLCFGTALSY